MVMETLTPIKGSHEPYKLEKHIIDIMDIEWNKSLWPYTFYWSVVYIMVIFSLRNYMKSKPAYTLRRPLVAWNIFLALFSICGTLRMVPGLWIEIRDFGFTFSVCNISFARKYHPISLWILLFSWSKVLEFGDTLFIVLRKQHLMFLHWYHHVATLTFTWFSAANEASTGYWFSTMNYFVHSFMYTYFALKAMKVRVPRYVAMMVTTMQIMQMFMGSFVTFWAVYKYYTGEYCEQTNLTLLSAVLLYLSYVVMFCHLFYNLYLVKRDKPDFVRKVQ